MNDDLSALSLEELWRLFPIVLREHDPAWPDWYREEAAALRTVPGRERIARVSHIGSTAVPGLVAKPTVDILLEITRDCAVAAVREDLTGAGWLLMHVNDDHDLWLVFNKGYTPQGFAEKIFHLHVRYPGDWDELYFRDWLRAHPDTAGAYAALKRQLAGEYRHDRDGYTEAKTPFIRQWTAAARAEYGERYLP